MQFKTKAVAFSLALSAAAFADKGKEPHLDIWLRTDAGAVVTGSITEGTPGEPVAERASVFSGDFGTDPAFPFAAFEPGFQALATGFVTTYSFEIAGPLLRFGPKGYTATASTMTLSYGPSSTTSGESATSGFAFNSYADGLLHDHFDYVLNGFAGADPESGVYALPIRFSSISPAADAGNIAWIVLNAGEAEATHDTAIREAELFLACGIDLSGDGRVDASDIAQLLGAWGTDNPTADLDGSGAVNAADLATLLAAWGFECP